MSVEINTYSKVVKSFNYLERQLEKAKLSKEKAILYFQILLKEEESDLVQRPHFTFQLEDFDRYLRFLQHHNFIGSADDNTFHFYNKHWKEKQVAYVVLSEEFEKEILQLIETYEELNSCFNISA